MTRFMYALVLAAAVVLAATTTATGGTRPDDRATHGPGSLVGAEPTVLVRPDDRALHRPGSLVGAEPTVLVRPDDRAIHRPGAFADRTPAGITRPDDRAWRGAGPVPVEVVETASVGADGFDWADAGIGAAGALGLALLMAGGSVLVLRRQRLTALP